MRGTPLFKLFYSSYKNYLYGLLPPLEFLICNSTSAFAHHYWQNLTWFIFPPSTEMFQFLGLIIFFLGNLALINLVTNFRTNNVLI